MAITLNASTRGVDNLIFYDEDFRNVLEDHLSYLRGLHSTNHTPVDIGIAARYAGDFYGLMDYLSVPIQLHWISMRMTGLYSPMESTMETTTVLIPDMTEVEQLRSYHMSKTRV